MQLVPSYTSKRGKDTLASRVQFLLAFRTINPPYFTASINSISSTNTPEAPDVPYMFEDITKFDKRQEWPIHFSIKMREDCWRILFEHANGELYQLDIPNSIYKELMVKLEKEVESIVYN